MKTAALLLVLAAPAWAGVVEDTDATTATLLELGRLAPAHARRIKVMNLAEVKEPELLRLSFALSDYAVKRRLALPAPAASDAGVTLAQLWGDDFDDAYLAELVDRSEALVRPLDDALRAAHEAGDVERETMLRLALHTLEGTMNDARRARGEYVPLAPR